MEARFFLTAWAAGGYLEEKGRALWDGTGTGHATTRQQKAFGLSLGAKWNGNSAMLHVAHRVSHDRHHDDGNPVLAAMEGAGVEEGDEYGSSFASLLCFFSSPTARLLDSSGMR